MKKNDEKNTHGFLSNLIFMIREQWNFEKKGVIIPFIRIPSDIAVALLGVLLTKVVLDAITKSIPAYEFLEQIGLLTILLMILSYVSYYTEQNIYMNSVKIWNLHFYLKKDWKIVDMDYPLFASPAGKTKIMKSHQALNRNIYVNMVSFYPHFVELVKNLFGLFSFCAVLVFLNPIIILLLILSYVIHGLVVLYIEKWEHKTKDERAIIDRKLDYAVHCTSDSSVAKDIRLYNMKSWINTIAQIFLNEKLSWQNKIASKHFLQSLLETLLIFLRNFGAYIYLIWKVMKGEMTIGDFALYFGVITGFGQWLEQIIQRLRKLSTANHKVDDYRYLMDTEDMMRRNKGALLPRLDEPIEIVLENVSFKYVGNDDFILEKINLKIHKGERLAIVGSNGAGKTTLVNLICGLIEPVSGRILLNGTNINEFNRDEYYALITAVFQKVCLLPASIAKNIALRCDNEIDWGRLCESAEDAGIKGKIESLPDGFNTNLVPSVTENGVAFSGGENQKLLLARALYKDAPLLILDEPTAALDPIAENEMYLKYDDLTKNKTSIYISHRLSSTQFCDRIIYLDNKKIVETGTHDELMTLGGKYRQVYDVQSQYYRSDEEEKAV
ncbi:hypothetical protein BVG16_07730 [Paenibacillus selenitireducens]|uniref:ABC transporter ATP-binding protein n=1 Tax=Paenibacillus selenitireducens TaxID=1324314 RepID=A0A1T2XL56_9BACL|nr:ABC transporter ATP-binding protein [Paenibacillus selenitireducens]OPA80597.1 hypothetical protein BVG16_07730 [Paenibacillus selenitireducens]